MVDKDNGCWDYTLVSSFMKQIKWGSLESEPPILTGTS